MIRPNNHITVLLAIIVIMLFVGLGLTLYYVLDLDWFERKPVEIYSEVNPYSDEQKQETQIKNQINFDITKRTYNIVLNTDELKIIVYKDGTVGIKMLENTKYSKISKYNELLNKEVKLSLTNIIRAYNVELTKKDKDISYILLLDNNGNIYNFIEQELTEKSEYTFAKLEGITKIIDIAKIENETTLDTNVIAIDQQSNEILLDNYLNQDK